MRVACGLLVGMVFVAACSSGTAPMDAPPKSLAGSWSSWGPGHPADPGGAAVFTLSQSGDSVAGTYTWILSEPVQGSYVAPNIVFVVTDTLGGRTSVDTLRGVGQTATTIVVGGATYYKQ